MKHLLLILPMFLIGCASTNKYDAEIQKEYYRASVSIAKYQPEPEPTCKISCPEKGCQFDELTCNGNTQQTPIALQRSKTTGESNAEIAKTAIKPLTDMGTAIGLGVTAAKAIKTVAENGGQDNTNTRNTNVINGDNNTNGQDTTLSQSKSSSDGNSSHSEDNDYTANQDNDVTNPDVSNDKSTTDRNDTVNNDDNSVVNNDDNSVDNTSTPTIVTQPEPVIVNPVIVQPDVQQ